MRKQVSASDEMITSVGSNAALSRIRSWAEDVRHYEVERTLRRLQSLDATKREEVVLFSKRLISELLAPSAGLDLTDERQVLALCGMFDRRDGDCSEAACPAASFCGHVGGREVVISRRTM